MWSTPRPDCFTPWKETQYPLYRRLGGPQIRSGRVRKISPLPGFDLRTVHPVASRFTDWAIPVLLKDWTFANLKKNGVTVRADLVVFTNVDVTTDESGIYEAVIKLVYAWFKILTAAFLKIQASGMSPSGRLINNYWPFVGSNVPIQTAVDSLNGEHDPEIETTIIFRNVRNCIWNRRRL